MENFKKMKVKVIQRPRPESGRGYVLTLDEEPLVTTLHPTDITDSHPRWDSSHNPFKNPSERCVYLHYGKKIL